ncbi:MAG: hypothetical protein O2968_03685 [Acidobacteria bacterium]|nr:hypothetical protein [Acidobacteriota bacterium]
MLTRNIGHCFVLGVVIAGFLLVLHSTSPAVRFGQFYDDTLYMSMAEALARGDGFVIPSLPGTPPQTKYPVLYPWVLSWIWRWVPAFPENVRAAVVLNAFAACWYLITAFLLLRRWKGIGSSLALAIVSICAFHYSFVFQSGQVTTEIPFAALMLTTLLCADLGSAKDSSSRWMWLAGVLAGLCVLMRTAGITVVGGIGLYLVLRRRYRDLWRFILASVPCAIGAVLWSLLLRTEVPPDAAPGWVQTWLFYTSYVDFWLLSITTPRIFGDMIVTNIDSIFMQVSRLTLFHDLGPRSLLARVLAFMLSVGVLAGLARHARRDEWRPIYFVFAANVVIVTFWSWPIASRVFVAFLPLLYVGLIAEMRHLWGALTEPFRSPGLLLEKVFASLLFVPLAWLLGTGAINYVRVFHPPEDRILLGQITAKEWAELHGWIEGNLPSDTIFLADLDTYLYLQTGHQAILPMAFTDDLYYDQAAPAAQAQYVRFMDVARHLQIRYWVVDGHALPSNIPELDEMVSAFQQGLPEVFRTRSGTLRILDLTCILQGNRDLCGDLLRRVTPRQDGS